MPNCSPAKLVGVTTFGKQQIPFLQEIFVFLVGFDFNHLDLGQIKITALNIGYSKVR